MYTELKEHWGHMWNNNPGKKAIDETLTKVKQMETEGKEIYPSADLIFNAYRITPPDKVSVVIIGQDPYHNEGQAMGLSFSVPQGVKVPPSLKNVYKELARDMAFIFPSHGDLTGWAEQGVFLLNAILTVEKNKPGSHKDIGWQGFTDATISYLSDHKENIVYMLWGNYAKSKRQLINPARHLILEAAHPSPLARNAFHGCGHFSQCNDYLKAHNRQPIDWQIR